MEIITINNTPDPWQRLIMTVEEYETLKSRIATGLLTFFDRIEFGVYREFTNSELIVRGYRNEWVAISTFYIPHWRTMTQDEFVTEIEERLKFLRINYDRIFRKSL